MPEFGAYLGPAVAKAGGLLGGYFDDRDKQKRENQLQGLLRSDRLRENAQQQDNSDRTYALAAQKPLAQANQPKYRSVDELEAAIIGGYEPDPDGSKMKAVQHHRTTASNRDYKPSEFELYQRDPEGYSRYKQAGQKPPTMKDRMEALFPGGRFASPYPGAKVSTPPTGLTGLTGGSNVGIGSVKLSDGSELTAEEYQMAKSAGLIP